MEIMLVYIILIGCIVYWVTKASKAATTRPEDKNKPGSMQNPKASRPGQQVLTKNMQNMQPKRDWNLGQSMAVRKEMEEKKSEMYSEADRELIQRGKEQSTTDYLKQKAAMDEKDHRQEASKQQQNQQRFEHANGMITAERLIEGDSIPQDRRVVKCGYCGADNLVPVNIRSRYACYFCREGL